MKLNIFKEEMWSDHRNYVDIVILKESRKSSMSFNHLYLYEL
jgi:hypothetical protein